MGGGVGGMQHVVIPKVGTRRCQLMYGDYRGGKSHKIAVIGDGGKIQLSKFSFEVA